jgi:hypothetical protein
MVFGLIFSSVYNIWFIKCILLKQMPACRLPATCLPTGRQVAGRRGIRM